ncbi:enoyl-ACP reductase-like protein [Paraburkholderia caballeronis]|nr:enoyl-ACP reductase-like protein [Paraburkholderia caballeronis]
MALNRRMARCVNPVLGDTGLTTEFVGAANTPENRERLIAGIAPGRFSTPQDIANACLYLAPDDDASFITGVCLEVDGGRCT